MARLSKPNDVWVVANQLYHRNTKTPLGYSAFSDASLEFYFYALAPGAVIGDSLEIAPKSGGTVWLLHHAHSGWSVKQEEMNRFVESLTRRFGTPQVKTWNIDSSERFEAYAFTAGASARDTDTGAPYTVTQSVHGMRKRIEQFTFDQSGTFYRFDGSIIPW